MSADIFTNLFLALGLLAASAVVAPLLAGKRKLAGVVNLVFVAAASVLLFAVSYGSIFGGAGHAARTIALGPVVIPFLVDGFAGIFLAVIALMAVASALYSIRYMEHYPEYGLRGYYLCYPLFILGMAGLVTVDDLAVGFSISWQVMTVASYFLIRFEHRKPGNTRNAAKYLVLMELAWLLVVGGAFFVNGYRFGEPLAETAGKIALTGGLPLLGFFGFLLAGFGMKAGVFPLGQLWLPDAHSIAPSPVSALLSGVMLKTGIYGLMRTFLFMAPAGDPAFDAKAWGLGIAALGAATLLIGTVQSMKQSDAKRLLAYSSIGQIGYIVLARRGGPPPGELRRAGAPRPGRRRGGRRPLSRHQSRHIQRPALPDERQYPLRDRDEGPQQARRPHQAYAGDRRCRRGRLALHLRHAADQRLREQVEHHHELPARRERDGVPGPVRDRRPIHERRHAGLLREVLRDGVHLVGLRMERREEGPRGPGLDARPQARPDGRLSGPGALPGRLLRPHHDRPRGGPKASC